MRANEIKSVKAARLVVDINVQRAINQARVEKMASDFKEEALGIVTASDRGTGVLFIVDGQHRVAAAKIAKGDDFALMCRVFHRLTLPEEAEMFRLLQMTRVPQALDSFRIAVIEGLPYAVHIDDMLTRYGLHLGNGVGTKFSAVVAAKNIYERDPMALERTLLTLTKAWGTEDRVAFDNHMIRGMGRMFARYADAIIVDDLIEKLQKMGGPARLLGKGNDIRAALNCRADDAIAEVLVELYNKNRRTRALPAWRS